MAFGPGKRFCRIGVLASVVCLAAMAGPACRNPNRPSSPRLHFHGDSITLWGQSHASAAEGSFPEIVQHARSSWEVTSGAVNGECTREGLPRFASYVIHRPCLRAAPCFAFLFEGINDPLPRHEGCAAEVAETVGRLTEMAEAARSAGWTPVLVTLPPAPDRLRSTEGGDATLCTPGFWEDWAGSVNGELHAAAEVGGFLLADLRTQWTLEEWLAAGETDVHPRTLKSRARIAEFLIQWTESHL